MLKLLQNINADVAAAVLSKAIQPLKTVYINHKGGLVDERTKKLITAIDVMDEEFDSLLAQDWCKNGDRLK